MRLFRSTILFTVLVVAAACGGGSPTTSGTVATTSPPTVEADATAAPVAPTTTVAITTTSIASLPEQEVEPVTYCEALEAWHAWITAGPVSTSPDDVELYFTNNNQQVALVSTLAPPEIVLAWQEYSEYYQGVTERLDASGWDFMTVNEDEPLNAQSLRSQVQDHAIAHCEVDILGAPDLPTTYNECWQRANWLLGRGVISGDISADNPYLPVISEALTLHGLGGTDEATALLIDVVADLEGLLGDLGASGDPGYGECPAS